MAPIAGTPSHRLEAGFASPPSYSSHHIRCCSKAPGLELGPDFDTHTDCFEVAHTGWVGHSSAGCRMVEGYAEAVRIEAARVGYSSGSFVDNPQD